MQFQVEYSAGTWVFTVAGGDNEPEYLEEFEVNSLQDAQAAALDLLEELLEADEVDDIDENDPLEGFFDDTNE